jgi:hypothetical protein
MHVGRLISIRRVKEQPVWSRAKNGWQRIPVYTASTQIGAGRVTSVTSPFTASARSNVPKSERLYSDRGSSAASLLTFFIQLPLCPRCLAPLHVRAHERAPGGRHGECHETQKDRFDINRWSVPLPGRAFHRGAYCPAARRISTILPPSRIDSRAASITSSL